MAIGIRHTGLVVRDLEKSKAFYQDILGLKLMTEAVEDGEAIDNVVAIKDVKLKYCKLVCEDNSMLELIQYLSHPGEPYEGNRPSNYMGCSHVCYTVKDIRAMHAALTECGYNCKLRTPAIPQR